MGESLNFVGQLFIGAVVGICAFLLTRLVSKNDENHNESKQAIRLLGKKVEATTREVQLVKSLQLRTDPKTLEAKISSLVSSLKEMQSEIDEKIRPALEQRAEDHGRVMVLEDSVEKNQKQINDLFKIMKKLHQKQQGL